MLDQLVMGDCDHLQTMLLAGLRVHTDAPLCSDTEQSFDGPTSPPPSNTTNLTHFYRCKKAMWTALQNDPRFPPVKRALQDAGFVANYSSPSWLYDEMIVNSRSWHDWTRPMLDPAPGRGHNRLIWDDLDVQRHSRYYQIGWGDALQHVRTVLLIPEESDNHSLE